MEEIKTELNICYASDNAYIDILLVSLVSLLESNETYEEIHIFILECNKFSQQSIERIKKIQENYKREITLLSVYEMLEQFNSTAIIRQFSLAAYARLLLGDILPPSVEKCFYLDCDTIICSELDIYKFCVDDYAVYAVIDTWFQSYNERIGLGCNDLYFNSGVLLFNLEKWRKEKWQNMIIHHIKTLSNPYKLNDQDVLNVILRGKIGVLPLKYNMIYVSRMYTPTMVLKYSEKNEALFYSRKEIALAQSNPVIVHYAGGFVGKPWVIECFDKHRDIWRKYAKKVLDNNYQYKRSKIKVISKVKFFIKKSLPMNVLACVDYVITKGKI